MIHISAKDFEHILAHCKQHAPEEACGLMLGEVDEIGDTHVREVRLLENTDHSSEHFTIDPEDQLKTLLDARHLNLAIVANFHSHPATPARPSHEDLRLANDPRIAYLILSLADANNPQLKAFRVDAEKNVYEEPIDVS